MEKTNMKNRPVDMYCLTSNKHFHPTLTVHNILGNISHEMIAPAKAVTGVYRGHSTTSVYNSRILLQIGDRIVTVETHAGYAFTYGSKREKTALTLAAKKGKEVTLSINENDTAVTLSIKGGISITQPVNNIDYGSLVKKTVKNETLYGKPVTNKILEGELIAVDYHGPLLMKDDGEVVQYKSPLNNPEMANAKLLVGNHVRVALNDQQELTIQSLDAHLERSVDKKPEMKHAPAIKTTHIIRLTHREDLNGYTSVEGRDYQKPIFHQGASKVAGQLIEANPNYGTFTLEHPVYGRVGVSVGKRLFQGDPESCEALFKACEEKKPVAISLDKTGTSLTVAIKDGPTLVNKMQSPAIPFGLVDAKQVSAEKTYRGKLNAVHAEHSVELQTDKGPLIVYGRGGASAEVTLKKMMGKQVEVSAGKDNALVVKTLEREKGLAR